MADWGLGQIGTRLALSFVAVALMAEAAFAAVSVVTERSDVASLVSAQRAETRAAVTSALDNAYGAGHGWTGADFKPAVALVNLSGAGLSLDSREGAALLRSGHTPLLGSDEGVRRKVGGSGIGLAVVKDLVEAHGGEVRVESPPIGGARFVVSLPSSTASRGP